VSSRAAEPIASLDPEPGDLEMQLQSPLRELPLLPLGGGEQVGGVKPLLGVQGCLDVVDPLAQAAAAVRKRPLLILEMSSRRRGTRSGRWSSAYNRSTCVLMCNASARPCGTVTRVQDRAAVAE
jgi:hypothetical protein